MREISQAHHQEMDINLYEILQDNNSHPHFTDEKLKFREEV